MKRPQPIGAVEWVPREAIEPNDYNPNKQAPPEHKLLKVSILADGWTQPIVVFDDGAGGKPVIVDGEHRWRCSADPAIAAITGGLIPIVRVRADRSQRIMATIRHNRARGEHAVVSMAELIKELLEAGFDADELQAMLGMESEEVQRLAEKAGLPTVVSRATTSFKTSWIPG